MVQDISRTDCSRTAGKHKKKKKRGKEKKKNKSINNMHIDKLPEQWKKVYLEGRVLSTLMWLK